MSVSIGREALLRTKFRRPRVIAGLIHRPSLTGCPAVIGIASMAF